MRLPTTTELAHAWKYLRHRRRSRGQAMMETTILTFFVVAWGASLMYFFPDSLNALQIYMDSFYYVLSLPVP